MENAIPIVWCITSGLVDLSSCGLSQPLFSIVYHVFDFPFLMSTIILLLCISVSFVSLYIQPINIFIDTGNIIVVSFHVPGVCRFEFYQLHLDLRAENEEWLLKMHLCVPFYFFILIFFHFDSLHFPVVHLFYSFYRRDFLPNAFQIWLTFHLLAIKLWIESVLNGVISSDRPINQNKV